MRSFFEKELAREKKFVVLFGGEISPNRMNLVYKTNNYNLFTYDNKKGRKVKTGSKSFYRLKKHLENKGLVNPIIVSLEEGKLKILSGRRRFEALKALGQPIEFILEDRPNLTEEDYIGADIQYAKYSIRDFISIGKERNISMFVVIEEIQQKYGLLPSVAYEIVAAFIQRPSSIPRYARDFTRLCAEKGIEEVMKMCQIVTIGARIKNNIEKYIWLVKEITNIIKRDMIRLRYNRALLEAHLRLIDGLPSLYDILDILKKKPELGKELLPQEVVDYRNKIKAIYEVYKAGNSMLVADNPSPTPIVRKSREKNKNIV